jgi:hypothetical protein
MGSNRLEVLKGIDIEIEKGEHSYTYKTGAIYSGQWLGGFRHGPQLVGH